MLRVFFGYCVFVLFRDDFSCHVRQTNELANCLVNFLTHDNLLLSIYLLTYYLLVHIRVSFPF